MQKTNFKFEAIVHDDASTDGTAAIILEYAEKYPDIIKPIIEIENQYSKKDGSLRRIMDLHTHGKYVALCEGDDYWTDPYKLQKQVDFLEANEEYGLVYGKAKVFIQDLNVFASLTGEPFVNLESMILCNSIPTLTVLFKRELLLKYREENITTGKSWLMGDYPMWLYFVYNTKVKFIDEVFGVYRFLKLSAVGRDSFEKREQFIKSEYDIRMFYAIRYGLDIIKEIEQVYYKSLFYNAIFFCKVDKVRKYFFKIITPTKKEKIMFNIYQNLFLIKIYLVYKIVKNWVLIKVQDNFSGKILKL